MKKLISILLCLCMIFALAGCGSSKEAKESTDDNNRFDVVYSHNAGFGSSFNIIVDTETNVAYLFIKSGYGGGLSVMTDEEGKPLIWGEDKEVEIIESPKN